MKTLFTKLDKYEQFKQAEYIIIENQPVLKNPTMKSIQMMVYSYFLINGVCSESSSINNIEMINARNKLKAYKGPPVICDIKDKYKKTKFLGIQYCLSMITESNQTDKWINLFTTSLLERLEGLLGCFILLKKFKKR